MIIDNTNTLFYKIKCKYYWFQILRLNYRQPHWMQGLGHYKIHKIGMIFNSILSFNIQIFLIKSWASSFIRTYDLCTE